jgi:hypothetical protein
MITGTGWAEIDSGRIITAIMAARGFKRRYASIANAPAPINAQSVAQAWNVPAPSEPVPAGAVTSRHSHGGEARRAC